jgi:hypothetical protein
MIRETRSDILTADVDTLVCPVNTVGVMGAGLAKQFRLAYPAYVRRLRECLPSRRDAARIRACLSDGLSVPSLHHRLPHEETLEPAVAGGIYLDGVTQPATDDRAVWCHLGRGTGVGVWSGRTQLA